MRIYQSEAPPRGPELDGLVLAINGAARDEGLARAVAAVVASTREGYLIFGDRCHVGGRRCDRHWLRGDPGPYYGVEWRSDPGSHVSLIR